MWKIVEAKTRKIGIEKTKKKRKKEGSRKEIRKERRNKKPKKEKTMEVKRIAEEQKIWDKEE